MNTHFLLFVFVGFIPWNAVARDFKEDVTITLDQKHILDRFRNLVGSRLPHDYMHEDIYLMRWLRARDWNMRAAEVMLMKHLKYREEQRLDTAPFEDWSDLRKEYPFWLESRDREGRPVLYQNIGDQNLRRVALSGKSARFRRYVDTVIQEGCYLARELGRKYKNVSQGVVIENLDGFNLVEQGCLRCLPLLISIFETVDNHHPGCLDKLIIVNTPSIFQPIITAFRSVVRPETAEALRIFGTNKAVWQKELDKWFDRSELPPELGGTKEYEQDENNIIHVDLDKA